MDETVIMKRVLLKTLRPEVVMMPLWLHLEVQAIKSISPKLCTAATTTAAAIIFRTSITVRMATIARIIVSTRDLGARRRGDRIGERCRLMARWNAYGTSREYCVSPLHTRGGSRMPELGPYGSVRGARGNSHPYRHHTSVLPQ